MTVYINFFHLFGVPMPVSSLAIAPAGEGSHWDSTGMVSVFAFMI